MPYGNPKSDRNFFLNVESYTCGLFAISQGGVVNLNGMVVHNKVMIRDSKYLLQLPQSC
ncbi:hypothetical protein [uncultured Nostoc sp.]|uniref:hypothetical protein n=1 Tax=uncultured Nostoc sp. TaxID=340711 RepID=UPI0035CA6C20